MRREPGIKKYTNSQGTFWALDVWVTLPDGRMKRVEKRKIPTREQAIALKAKLRAEAFEGRYFDRLKVPKITVAQLWANYEPISRRDKDSWQSDVGRAKHLLRHLGERVAAELTQKDVDEYRNLRFAENTRRGTPPAPATLDLELAQLKRMCSYAVECGQLQTHPIARVKLLHKPNVRRVKIDEPTFVKLLAAADPAYRPILLVAYDTGMREGEILNLRWLQLDLKAGAISLSEEDTKTNKARTVYLTERTLEELRRITPSPDSPYIFVSQRTGSKWSELRRKFDRARQSVGLPGLWFHDLRRSFVTNSRKRGIAESVVMRMSGHRTRSVFDRYNIVDDEDVRQAVKVIEAAVRKDLEDEQKPPGDG